MNSDSKDRPGQGQRSERPGAESARDAVQGEGNYEAARRYNDASREHAENADVEGEARDAAPLDDAEADELELAEEEGRARAAEEDPLLDEPERIEGNEGADERFERGEDR